MPVKKEISLLPDAENANSFTNRLLKWVTTVGRVIIIITELVVVGAFLSRFWLDRKNADLSEIIRQQKAILETTSQFEKDYSLLQQRLKFIKENSNSKNLILPQGIQTVSQSLPTNITLDNIFINIKEGQVTVKTVAIAYEESAIVDLVSNLSLNPDISKISVQRIEKKPKDNKYYVDLNLSLKYDNRK